jgi:TrmH family RNA methyltransferase
MAALRKSHVQFVRSLGERQMREAERLFVADGIKLAAELLASPLRVAHLYLTPAGRESVGRLADAAGEVWDVDDDEMARLSSQRSPQGALALVEMPWRDWRAHRADEGLTLALDDLQDPGNAGTIVRVADWFGVAAIVASPQSVDLFHPKVVQATMGSIARIPLYRADLGELLDHQPAALPVVGAALDGEDLYDRPLPPAGILVVGNEAHGIGPRVEARLTRRVRIPAYGGGAPESLNAAVATAILCAEWRRPRR